jgi:uncharacterized ferredoxin-like protein
MTNERMKKLRDRLDLIAEESSKEFLERNKDALDRLSKV